jgi:NAD(P)-dependent dehydrogenase (short-subunit alcohol dehydrogenase family)
MSSKLFDLSGRTGLVTGSARGLGNVLAAGLAEAGATIVLNGRNTVHLSSATAALRQKGHTVHETPFDVTDEKAVQNAFARLDEAGISVDILVNNAVLDAIASRRIDAAMAASDASTDFVDHMFDAVEREIDPALLDCGLEYLISTS